MRVSARYIDRYLEPTFLQLSESSLLNTAIRFNPKGILVITKSGAFGALDRNTSLRPRRQLLQSFFTQALAWPRHGSRNLIC